MAQTPKKWTTVYPQGTPEGNEEQKFFIALARNPKFVHRSAAAIAKESGLTIERVEQIIQKYVKVGIVVQSKNNADLWGYWERVEKDEDEEQKSIGGADVDARINKASGITATSNPPATTPVPAQPAVAKKKKSAVSNNAPSIPGGNSAPVPTPPVVDDDDEDDSTTTTPSSPSHIQPASPSGKPAGKKGP